jgi:hypothetical protein
LNSVLIAVVALRIEAVVVFFVLVILIVGVIFGISTQG